MNERLKLKSKKKEADRHEEKCLMRKVVKILNQKRTTGSCSKCGNKKKNIVPRPFPNPLF